MVVSIVVCTRNRADSLRKTLASLAAARVPAGMELDVLVVDNGSTDHTKEVVGDARAAWKNVRLELETQQGVANARTKALHLAKGEIILWTDDDVTVPADWIDGMTRPILQGELDAVAGGVRLGKGLERSWMGTCHRSWLASSEGLDPKKPGRMIGANMAFHRRVLAKVDRFDSQLGPGALGMGEETLFSYQLESAGFRLGAALDVVVEHDFDEGRLNRVSFERIAKAMGRSEAYIAYHWHGIDSRNKYWRVLDAYLRWISWCVRGWFVRGVPNGLLERRLQACSRIAYWRWFLESV